MARPSSPGIHMVIGGFPPGSNAGHDIAFARRRLLELVAEVEHSQPTISTNFDDIETWLPTTQLLLTYTSGPFPAPAQNAAIGSWLEAGGRWFALHGTSGGKAVPIDGDRRRRKMVLLDHHSTLGGFFLNHPPVQRFVVDVVSGHPLTAGLASSFETEDELYLIEVLDPECEVLLTTDLPEDPSPPGFGFEYDHDTSLLPDGRTRVLGYVRDHGSGAVAYVALGHCHSPATNSQPFVDVSVDPEGKTPKTFRGSWESEAFSTLLTNGIRWGLQV